MISDLIERGGPVLGVIMVCAVLVLAVALAIRSMVRDRRAGKSACGGNCASCGACACGAAAQRKASCGPGGE